MPILRMPVMILVMIFGAVGCTIDDDDRCLSGYQYDSAARICRPLDTDSVSGPKNGSDTGSDEAETDEGPRGYGETCTDPGGCAAFDADYCLLDPGKGEGICTVQGCLPGECPAGSKCCDCTNIERPVLCLYDDIVDSIMGKVCNGCE